MSGILTIDYDYFIKFYSRPNIVPRKRYSASVWLWGSLIVAWIVDCGFLRWIDGLATKCTLINFKERLWIGWIVIYGEI